jgi:hypothetical protein
LKLSPPACPKCYIVAGGQRCSTAGRVRKVITTAINFDLLRFTSIYSDSLRMTRFKRKIIEYFILLLIIVALIVAGWIVLFLQSFENDNFELGTDFSVKFAKELKIDWQDAYLAMLDDLQVKKIRIHAPWDQIEPSRGEYNFEELDFQIKEASQRDVEIILAIGRRTPRWPECHDPAYIKSLPADFVQDKQFQMMRTVVERYKSFPAIKVWQVENEPLLDVFGECPSSDADLLRREVNYVKSLDNSRPVLVTDSGELGLWIIAANVSDLFGTTMYRVTYNKWLGYNFYKFPPIFYRLKAQLVGRDPNTVIVSELQAEPWAEEGILSTPLEEQRKSMDSERLLSHIEFVKKTGFNSAYLWGVEWWYWLANKKSEPEMWNTAKDLFSQQ